MNWPYLYHAGGEEDEGLLLLEVGVGRRGVGVFVPAPEEEEEGVAKEVGVVRIREEREGEGVPPMAALREGDDWGEGVEPEEGVGRTGED